MRIESIRPIEVPPNSVVMSASSERHKEMPDGMGEGDAPITLEEDRTEAVEDAASQQLHQTIRVGLQ